MVEDFMYYETSIGILQLEEIDKILIIKIWQNNFCAVFWHQNNLYLSKIFVLKYHPFYVQH